MLIPVGRGVVSTAGHPNSAARAHQMDPHTSPAVARAPSCPAPTSTGARRSGIATCGRHARRSPGFGRPILPRIHARDSWSSIFGSRSPTASLACDDRLVGCFVRSFRCPCICVETRHQRIVRQIAFRAPRPPSRTPKTAGCCWRMPMGSCCTAPAPSSKNRGGRGQTVCHNQLDGLLVARRTGSHPGATAGRLPADSTAIKTPRFLSPEPFWRSVRPASPPAVPYHRTTLPEVWPDLRQGQRQASATGRGVEYRPDPQWTPLTLAENELTPAPVLPLHGSKPAWILVRYHELLTGSMVSVLLTKPITSKLSQEFIGVFAT